MLELPVSSILKCSYNFMAIISSKSQWIDSPFKLDLLKWRFKKYRISKLLEAKILINSSLVMP